MKLVSFFFSPFYDDLFVNSINRFDNVVSNSRACYAVFFFFHNMFFFKKEKFIMNSKF